jgi:uncharacterized membrane protein
MKNKKVILSRLVIFILGMFFFSCKNYYVEKKSDDDFNQSLSANSEISFEIVKSVVFLQKCTVCHQQYNSYQSVKRELVAIQDAIAQNRMPKSGSLLTDRQKDFLTKWASQGAPEFAGQTPQPEVPVITEANWKSISQNIIFPKCIVCHNPNGQAKFLDLSTRESILLANNERKLKGENLLDFDKPAESDLIKLVEDPLEPMPPIKSNISRLTNEEVNVLKAWIGLKLPE